MVLERAFIGAIRFEEKYVCILDYNDRRQRNGVWEGPETAVGQLNRSYV